MSEYSEWEHVYVDDLTEFTVHISKVGGGTIGRSYEGEWEFEVLNSDGSVIHESYFYTGMPKTHSQAAKIVVSYYDPER